MTDTSKEQFEVLITRFGSGWEKGRTDEIVGVFAATAAFRPDPHATPITGHEAIRAYWKDIPFTQAEIKFRSGEVFTVGPWFAVEFKCTFRSRRTGELMDVRGMMACETADALITEMRLYWQRHVGARG